MSIQFLRAHFSKRILWILLSAAAILLVLSALITVPIVIAYHADGAEKPSSPQSPLAQTTAPPTDVTGMIYQSHENGTCSVIGIGSCTETDPVLPKRSPAGDLVIAIGANAFAECDFLISVTIPSDVKIIGQAAFYGCSSLVAIEVERDNAAFCSVGGVLYSRDKTSLVCYPPNKATNKYLLNINTRFIAPYAFYGNRNLTHLLYEETVDSFQDIKIAEGNSLLSTVTITCNYTGSKS